MAKELNPTENIEKLTDIQRHVTHSGGRKRLLAANYCTTSAKGYTNACAATSHFLSQSRSLILAVAGRVSISL